MNDLERAKQYLADGCTCAMCRGERVFTSFQRGVKPLTDCLSSGVDYRDFSAADKVVGKATAFLYVCLGVKEVFAAVISRPALQVLQEHGIITHYAVLTEHIINRKGDGICPFEQVVLEISDPQDALCAIRDQQREFAAK